MARDKFFLSVRTAVGTILPRVDAEHNYTEPTELERILRGATFWLTPGSVAGFDAGDFGDFEGRETLERSVNAFLQEASKVEGNQPATLHQIEAASGPFKVIVGIVGKILLDDWLKAAGTILEQAIHWAEARRWPTKLYPRRFTELLIGTYELNRLVFGVEGSQMVLNPVGRFMPGADGMFDLAVMPTYDSIMIARKKEAWYIHPLPDKSTRLAWSEVAFVEAAEGLARLA